MSITLTSGQTLAVNKLLEFEKSDHLSASLIGFAGTGKTTIIDDYLRRTAKMQKLIFVSAPTHKAKSVIQAITSRKGLTIQSLLGLRPTVDLENFDYNNPKFKRTEDAKIGEFSNGVGIIDESSMLSKQLTLYLKEEAAKCRVKLIFVGDDYQLPPVKESYSTALRDSDIIIKLTEIVRQSELNPTVNLIKRIINDIDTGGSTMIDYLKENRNGIVEDEGYSVLDDLSFATEAKKLFKSDHFDLNKQYAKYIAWTNVDVSGFNEKIRKLMFDEPEYIENGELLFGYKHILLNDNSALIVNSEEYLVTSCKLMEYDSRLEEEGYSKIDMYRVSIKPLTGTEANTKIITIVAPEGVQEFKRVFNLNLKEALVDRTGWKQFYNYKQYKIVLGQLNNTAGEKYHKKPSYIGKDIDYGYGITVHKSQGSTYTNCIVNLRNIMRQRDPIERNKLIYVAITRASNKTLLYI